MGTRPDEIGYLSQSDDPTGLEAAPDSVQAQEATEPGTDDEARIRADIERTRAAMSQTIDALQEKLSPERIKEQVKEKVQEQAAEVLDSAKHAVKEATIGKAEKIMDNVSDSVNYATRKMGIAMEDSSILRSIRDNPLPFVLIGAGLGMLAMNKRNPTSESGYDGRNSRDFENGYFSGQRRYTSYDSGTASDSGFQSAGDGPGYFDSAKETVSQVADRTQEAVSSAAGAIKEKASGVAQRTREQVDYISDQASQGARRASDTLDTFIHDYPLAVALAAVAAGAAIGLALPSTRVESEYMGETRDQLVEKAQSVAKDTVEKVQRVAQEAGRTIQEEAKQQGLTSTT